MDYNFGRAATYVARLDLTRDHPTAPFGVLLLHYAPSVGSGVDVPAVYTVDVATFYKTDSTVSFAQQVEFATGFPDCIQSTLSVGTEYLLGLSWDSDGLLRIGAPCGLLRPWSNVEGSTFLQTELAMLTSGDCSAEPACGECLEFQVL